MKTPHKKNYLLLMIITVVFGSAIWSCKDDAPSLEELRMDRLAFFADSVRVSDSLRLTNNAGVVNYSITVVDGSTSSIFSNAANNGRTNQTQSAVDGAIVTISQYGKILKDTTDASGIVVFNGFFRSAVNVTIVKTDFTKVSYISGVNIQDSTRTGTISFVGNLIPIFPKTGTSTSTISGRATFHSNLTNKSRELVPTGTTVTAQIDADASDFSDKFLTTGINDFQYKSACGCTFIYVGNILQASYEATSSAAIDASGNYTIRVPAAVNGLLMTLQYSEFAADQTLFENVAATGQRTIVRRTVFNDNTSTTLPLAALPASSGVTVGFESFTTAATATAVISANAGTVDRINITNGGNGYLTGAGSAPLVQITGGGGTGATATATIGANGRVTGITLTNPGTGYTSVPTVSIISGGTSATATSALDFNNQQVFTISVTAQGTGYTSAPTVVFTGGGGTGASATAQVANGRVAAVVVTAGGTAFTAAPTITFTGGGGTGATATAFMGTSVAQVNMVSIGANHVYAPVVTFSAPDYSNGVRAVGQAVFDPSSRTVLGVLVTNPGSGYNSAPTVTIDGGSGATAQAFLTGGSVISFNITNPGLNYAYAPTVIIGATDTGNGSGATGTAVMSGGRLVGINLVGGGTGYTAAPSVQIVSGDGAVAYATVDTNGAITGFTVTDGGRNFAGAPRVLISGDGGGASATATVAGGQITGITVVSGGTGYQDGNTPGTAERFSAVKGTSMQTKPGLTYINDVYYGTGAVRQPN